LRMLRAVVGTDRPFAATQRFSLLVGVLLSCLPIAGDE
jgi:hypothetical protein